jgi:hypothetical protein
MIPEYVEQAGVYRNPETNKFMGTAEAESILEALNSQSALLQEIDENTEVSPEEERQRSLNEEDTQTKKGVFSGMGGKIGDGLKSVGGFLKNKNPLSSDRNPLTRLLGFGALAGLLKLLGDKLTGEDGALTNLLKWFKLTFIPRAESTWKMISDYDYQAGFDKIKLFFKQIKDFFDTDDDGEISFDEIKEGIPKAVALMASTIGNALVDGVKKLFELYGKEIALVFAGYVVSKMLIKSLLFGGALPAVGGLVGGAALRVAGLAAVMVTGLVTLHNDIDSAYKDVLERDGKVNVKTLMSRFLSGDNNPHGRSWTDAILGSWKMGLQGAAVGLTAGLVTGGVFSIPLAAIGFITGATASAMGAHLGEDKLNKNMEDAETNIMALADDLKTTGNRVYNFFKGIVDAGKAMVDGETTMAGAFNLATKGDGAQKYKQYDMEAESITKAIEYQKLLKKQNPQVDAAIYDDVITRLQAQKDTAIQNRDEAFQTAENVQTQSALNEYGSIESRLNELKSLQGTHLKNNRNEPALALQAEIDVLEGRKRQLGKDFMSGNMFSATLQAPDLEQPEIKKFRNAALYEKNQAIIKNLRMKNAMSSYEPRTGPAVINAPTSIKNEGDKIISSLNAVPAYSAANMLTQTWISAIGNPHATFNR